MMDELLPFVKVEVIVVEVQDDYAVETIEEHLDSPVHVEHLNHLQNSTTNKIPGLFL